MLILLQMWYASETNLVMKELSDYRYLILLISHLGWHGAIYIVSAIFDVILLIIGSSTRVCAEKRTSYIWLILSDQGVPPGITRPLYSTAH